MKLQKDIQTEMDTLKLLNKKGGTFNRTVSKERLYNIS